MCASCMPPDGIVLIPPNRPDLVTFHEARLRALGLRQAPSGVTAGPWVTVDGVDFPHLPTEAQPVVRSLGTHGHREGRYVLEEINGRLRKQLGGGTW